MAEIDLMTLKETRAAIRKARIVLVQARFGVSEDWLKLAKTEALSLLQGLDEDTTPQRFEMYADRFGAYDEEEGVLYLG